MKCFWCNTDPEEANRAHEGTHATWCPRFERAATVPRFRALDFDPTQDFDSCPYCDRPVAFHAFDSHVKRCMARQTGDTSESVRRQQRQE